MARLLTLNTYLLDIRLFGWLRVYPAAPCVDRRLALLPAALRGIGADVICLQEVYRRPHREYLAARLKDAYPHCAGIDHPGLPLGTGLMVLSRHPITWARPHEFRAAFLEERLAIRMGMLECGITLPRLGPCRVINFHLAAGGLFGHPEGRRGEHCRTRQIGELLDLVGQPAAAPTMAAGDLNAGPHTSIANYRQMLDAGLADAVADGMAPGSPAPPAFTWDPTNPLIGGGPNRILPAQRIDHIFFHRQGAPGLDVGKAEVVLDEAPVTLADGRRVPLSDHYGLVAEIDAPA